MALHRSSSSPRDVRADVVVAGSRVAGAATAMLLARAGHDVVMIDRIRHPSDTLSTHAIARGGVVQLSRWGLLDEVLATGAPPVREVSFHTHDGSVTRTVAETAGVDLLMAPRRHKLDPVLVDAAVDAGVRLIDRTTVSGVRRDDTGRVIGLDVHDQAGAFAVTADHVVGADGVRSTVARSVGSPVVDARPSPSGTHYLYAQGLDAVGFEFHVGGGGFAGVFPTHDAAACVFLCAPEAWSVDIGGTPDQRSSELLRLLRRVSPSLVERMGRASLVSPVRGATRLPNHVRRGSGEGWWLVGDAGYHRDPITGHGITDAFRHAELLADAIHAQSTGQVDGAAARAGYELQRRCALADIFDLTCALVEYPPTDEFLALQKRFSELLEIEALELAAIGPRPWTARSLAA